MTSIPILDLGPEIDQHWEALNEAFQRVLRSGQFIGGEEVRAFEAEVADYLSVGHAVSLNSGTDAIVIALRTLGIGPGDEVITTPFTFFATAEAISSTGATPVFVDVEQGSYNLNPDLIAPAITPRTRAVLPVHLFGLPAAMAQILEIAELHGLAVIEDCAQSFGGRYEGACPGCDGRCCAASRRTPLVGRATGTLGTVGTFSFFPTKPLGAFGDGGLLATDDREIAITARKLRAHGGIRKYHNEFLGYNSRLDAIQAAMLRVKLPHVDVMNAARRERAMRYTAALDGLPGIVLPDIASGHVVHQYTIRVLDGRRDEIAAALDVEQIQTMVYYPVPLHRLPMYADGAHGSLQVSERLAEEVLSLPVGPTLSRADQDRIIRSMTAALAVPRPGSPR